MQYLRAVGQALRRPAQAWHVVLALFLLNLLDSTLAEDLPLWSRLTGTDAVSTRLIDDWLPNVLLVLLLLSLVAGWTRLARWFMLGLLGVTTLQLLYSAVMLVVTLPRYPEGEDAFSLLVDALSVWTVNLLLFALWYWTLDGGGPRQRQHAPPAARDFLFPLQINPIAGHEDWQPHFVDYLFAAFSASTAFSPTDTLIVTRRAKALTMLQATISLLTITVVTARAVNIIR
jgi:hypothetical protein